jgi:hypothetical protein
LYIFEYRFKFNAACVYLPIHQCIEDESVVGTRGEANAQFHGYWGVGSDRD